VRTSLVEDRTRAVNRLRGTLLSMFPALERALDVTEARLKKRSSNRAAYSSNGPGAGGHGRRAVIFMPQQGS
jgi:hypothetical protein